MTLVTIPCRELGPRPGSVRVGGLVNSDDNKVYGIASIRFVGGDVRYFNRTETRELIETLQNILGEAGPEPLDFSGIDYMRDCQGYVWERAKDRLDEFICIESPEGEPFVGSTIDVATINKKWGPLTKLRKLAKYEEVDD